MTKPQIPFYKFHPREVQSASVAITEMSTPFVEANIFLADFNALLGKKIQILSAAIQKSNAANLTKQSKVIDDSFGTNFQNLRTLVNAKATMASLEQEAESCAILAKSIEEFGGAVEDMPKEVQIVTMDELFQKWESGEMQHHVNLGQVKRLYEASFQDHVALKTVEKERSAFSSHNGEIPAEWEAGRDATPVLSTLYNHIKDYAEFGKEGYEKLLADINAELTPIVTQVRARDTRNDSDSAS